MKLSNKYIYALGTGVFILVLAGAFYGYFFTNEEEERIPKKQKEAFLTLAENIPVRVSGVLTSADTMVVYAETSGNVVHLAKEGDTVSAQSLIAQLDTPVTEAQLALSTAQTRLTDTQQKLVVEQAQANLLTQNTVHESAVSLATLRDEGNSAQVQETFQQLLTSIELSLLTSIETLDYIDTNRTLFSYEGLTTYATIVEMLYGRVPNHLRSGLITANSTESAELLRRLAQLQDADSTSVDEAVSLAKEVHNILLQVHDVLQSAEEEVLDERTTEVGGDVYSTYIEKRNAVVAVQASLESSVAQMQAVADSATQDLVTQEENTAVAQMTSELAKNTADLQSVIQKEATSVARSNNDVLRAQISLAYTYAPFSGVVSAVFVEAGEYVTAGTPLMELRGIGVYEVEVSVPAQFALYVEKGQAFTVKGETVGYVDRFAPVLEHGALRVFVTVGGEAFVSGNVLAGDLELASKDGDVYEIERKFVHFDATGPYVHFADGSKSGLTVVYDTGDILYVYPEEIKQTALLSAIGGTL